MRHAGGEPFSDGGEQLVADRMAERIVDVLEAVEVDIDQRGLEVAFLELNELLFQRFLELMPVRQVGEVVEMGDALDLAQCPLLRRHVFDHGDEGAGLGAFAMKFEEFARRVYA